MLKIYTGIMFSGKTEGLINDLNDYKNINKKVIAIKLNKDNRYTDKNYIITHNNIKFPCIKSNSSLNSIYNVLMEYDVIGIDESQFFSDLYNTVNKLLNNNKIVILAHLIADYKGEFFPTTNVFAIANDIIFKKIKCIKCNNMACYSHRKINDKNLFLIGDNNIYEPLCRFCFNKEKQL